MVCRFRSLCLLFLSAIFVLFVPGCITRVLQIRTDPPGAWVYLDGEEIGKTPLERPFAAYGTHTLIVAKEKHKPVNTTVNLKPPWWCVFPFDFFVELWPAKVVDKHSLSFELVRAEKAEVNLQKLMRNLDGLRGRLAP